MLCEKLFELNSKEECLENEGHDDGHYDHRENIEAHKEQSTPICFRCIGIAFHDNIPVVHN